MYLVAIHILHYQTVTLLAEALRTMETPPASIPPTLFIQVNSRELHSFHILKLGSELPRRWPKYMRIGFSDITSYYKCATVHFSCRWTIAYVRTRIVTCSPLLQCWSSLALCVRLCSDFFLWATLMIPLTSESSSLNVDLVR
jgi:hypothetical protein